MSELLPFHGFLISTPKAIKKYFLQGQDTETVSVHLRQNCIAFVMPLTECFVFHRQCNSLNYTQIAGRKITAHVKYSLVTEPSKYLCPGCKMVVDVVYLLILQTYWVISLESRSLTTAVYDIKNSMKVMCKYSDCRGPPTLLLMRTVTENDQ